MKVSSDKIRSTTYCDLTGARKMPFPHFLITFAPNDDKGKTPQIGTVTGEGCQTKVV